MRELGMNNKAGKTNKKTVAIFTCKCMQEIFKLMLMYCTYQ